MMYKADGRDAAVPVIPYPRDNPRDGGEETLQVEVAEMENAPMALHQMLMNLAQLQAGGGGGGGGG